MSTVAKCREEGKSRGDERARETVHGCVGAWEHGGKEHPHRHPGNRRTLRDCPGSRGKERVGVWELGSMGERSTPVVIPGIDAHRGIVRDPRDELERNLQGFSNYFP
jgi:hypothetical protein